MRRIVSVPEKTLEHWSSQYISSRFSTSAALWWPAKGQDIDVRWLPGRPGKAVQLELKTTVLDRSGVHDVLIDLEQLQKYLARSPGHRPFYVFPRPDPHWPETLEAAAMTHGISVSELAFSRSGNGWWFADWMVVMTADHVASVLQRELRNHVAGRRGDKRRLVRFDVRNGEVESTWGGKNNHVTNPEVVGWLDFWSEFLQCGRVGWPQLIRLPVWVLRTSGMQALRVYQPELIRELFHIAMNGSADEIFTEEELLTLEPGLNGNYVLSSHFSDSPELGRDERAGYAREHRLVVFIDAQNLSKSAGRPAS